VEHWASNSLAGRRARAPRSSIQLVASKEVHAVHSAATSASGQPQTPGTVAWLRGAAGYQRKCSTWNTPTKMTLTLSGRLALRLLGGPESSRLTEERRIRLTSTRSKRPAPRGRYSWSSRSLRPPATEAGRARHCPCASCPSGASRRSQIARTPRSPRRQVLSRRKVVMSNPISERILRGVTWSSPGLVRGRMTPS